MDKNAIKKYAVWARRELIEKVSQKALQYGIEDGKELDPKLESINGVLLTDDEKKQRQALIRKINENGYAQVMEEVAYTWFNRFIALRFMEVNGYLPSHVRVFTDEAGEFKPQIMSEALHLELKGLDMEKVYELKNDNRDDDLFKYLLITQCNDLSDIFPKMFQKIADYTELLLPDYLLRDGSVIEQMVNQKDGIPEVDWQDQVQIIGWLYQYYNTEPKDKVFADLKKNIKITKENIPAATQLFTPDWIVHYMVENSLGRLWLEGHPSDTLKSEWKYYLDEALQEESVQVQLSELRKEYATLKPEEIRVIDPCSGSGHILCVLFDVLVRIYEDYGHTAREAVTSIIENNLWGVDIDERAAQLSYFAVMMKARQYDRRFLLRKDENGNLNIPQPHVYVIEESNSVDPNCVDYFVDGRSELKSAIATVMKDMHDAKEYGSIINVTSVDFETLYSRFEEIKNTVAPDIFAYRAIDELLPIVQVAQSLSQKYHAVVTNPPYMGANGVADKLSKFIKDNYPDSKSDLFSVFIERCGTLSKNNGYYGMITQPSILFLTSFSNLRKKLIETQTISSLLHMGRGIFGIDFGSTSFVLRNSTQVGYKGLYFRLHERTFQYIDPDDIERLFFEAKRNHEFKYDFGQYKTFSTEDFNETNVIENDDEQHTALKIYFQVSQNRFLVIPGNPIAYWLSDKFVEVFEKSQLLGQVADSKQGIATADNNRFLREWYEVCIDDIFFNAQSHAQASQSSKKWYPYNKGGEFRKWYGNDDYVVNWQYDGQELRNYKKAVLRNPDFYFRECFSWSLISSGIAAFRYKTSGKLFDVAGMSCFANDNLYYYLALCNSVIATEVLRVIAPTINYQCGDIANIPVIMSQERKKDIETLARNCVEESKKDWDDYEISWDFTMHPLIRQSSGGLLRESYEKWEQECDKRFATVKNAEETINSSFIEIYGLFGEVDAKVKDKYITIRKAELQRDTRSFISYAVGCMFGRYSLDVPRLTYAGGEWDEAKYVSYHPDKDGIIPICDDEYFDDDIVGRFVEFVEAVYGKDTLEENLKYIADALGGNGTSREVIRNYFINDFYADHVKIYQKRPIYWLFDSGKKNGFKCLIYMHRYQPDTIARIRTDYVHEQQARYKTAIEEIEKRIETVSQSDKIKLTKKLNTLKAQDEEIHTYEEKIHHLADQMINIDLDDGVKHNYALFQDVLAKIK